MTLRDDFRGPLPLGENDFAEIRRRVLAKIERRPLLPLAFRFAAAAAAVAVIVFVLLPRHTAVIPPRSEAPRPSAASPPTIAAEGGHAPQPAAETVAPPEKPAPKQPKPVAVASKGAPPLDSEMHIEIQTADPNVRIIWIAR